MRLLFNFNAYLLANVVAHVILLSETPGSASELLNNKKWSSVAEDNPNCQRACAAIDLNFPYSVFLGQSGNFDFWDNKQAELVPACRVEPSSTEELSSLLSILIENDCHFAVKSGGHERSAGASNAAGGVTIDLFRLNSVQVADDRQSVTIGAGLRWGDVYRALEKEQLLILGGRVANVGVGGLLLGGGISFFSNERGLACDSIISYELVLPNTSVVTVGKDSHPNLYRSLRGAGHMNFGIVASFTLEAFPSHHRIWSGSRTVIGKDVEQMLRANYEVITKTMDADPYVAVMFNFAGFSKDGTCIASISAEHTTHNSTDHWPASLKQHGEMQTALDVSHMSINSVSNTTQGYAGATTFGRDRTIYGTTSYKPSVELELRILEIVCEEMESDRDIPGFQHGLTAHPLSTTMIANMRKNGGNAFQSLEAHTGPLIVLNVIWQWNEKDDDDRAYASYHRLMLRIEETAREMKLWHPYKYINYAEETQDIWNGYGDHTDLKQLQRDVDPRGIFASGGLAAGVHKLNGDSWSTAEIFNKADAQSANHKDEL